MLLESIMPHVVYDGTMTKNPLNAEVQRDIYFNGNWDRFLKKGMDQIWVKGNPSIDEANNAITHWFQMVITWDLEIDLVPRIEPIPRTLCEGFAVVRHRQFTADKDSHPTLTVLTKPWPQKPTIKDKNMAIVNLILAKILKDYFLKIQMRPKTKKLRLYIIIEELTLSYYRKTHFLKLNLEFLLKLMI